MSQKARVGIRIRQIRKLRRLTQEVLAEKVERSVDAISALERGLTLPSFETLEKLASALSVPVRDFFDADPDVDPSRARALSELVMHGRSLSDQDLTVAVEQIAALARARGKISPP